MIRRPLTYFLLLAATALAVVPAGVAVRAQDGVNLRGENLDGLPESPQDQPLSTPERVMPPTNSGSPSSADDRSPSTLPETNTNKPDDNSPNYGKKRKRKAKIFKPKAKGNVPLSPLVPYRGSPGTKKTLNPQPASKDAIDPVQPGPTVAVLQSPQRYRRPALDSDPFRPVGVRVGELILRPYVETSAGYETNPNQVQAGIKPSPALRAEGGLDVASDFSSSSLTAVIRGGYTEFPANKEASRPDLDAVINGRVDVTRHDTIETEARFLVATITPGTPLIAAPNAVFITSRPLIATQGATLGGTHVFGRLSLGLRSTFDRTEYGDATQSDGTTYRFSQDNYNDYGVVARAVYEMSPAISPFAETGFDIRVRDHELDLSGFARNSTGVSGKAGFLIDLFGHFTGTLDGGYLQRHYQDTRLPLLTGPVVDGRITYNVSALTTAALTASTYASETTLPFASGAIVRSVGLEVSHIFFSRFTLTGIALVQPDVYVVARGHPEAQGHDLYTTLSLKGVYSLSREIQLTASATRQDLKSTFAGQSFRDNIFLAGVRLQR